MHFHCVVIDGVFDTTAAGGVVFHANAGLDGEHVLRSFVQRGLLAGDDARAMGQWAHGGGFSMDGSVRIEAADAPDASACCATALGHPSPWTAT